MSYYHIKNIKCDRKNNTISADLADSNWKPLDWVHVDNLCDKESYEEKYANLIYNLVSGNFHPASNTAFSRIVMNHYLENYYDDAHDIGELETYNKYKEVIDNLMRGKYNNCVELKSEHELNPDKYYKLTHIDVDINDYNVDYYTNECGELYCIDDGNLKRCISTEKNYGYPLYSPSDMDKFKEYNEFLNSKELGIEL